MKILVLNGSPKGEVSVTMQYVKYIQKEYPQHEFQIVNAAEKVKIYEKNPQSFADLLEDIHSADGILWAFPLYVYLVHGNYKRFIELIWEKGGREAFRGKYAAALSTSIHFFDHTAHNYIQGICDDLEMKYVSFWSAEMNDLLNEKHRSGLKAFARNFFSAIDNQAAVPKVYDKPNYEMPVYTPGEAGEKTNASDKKIVLVADALVPGTNLDKMVTRFLHRISGPVEVVDLSKANIKGGCLGCIRCGFDNQCVYGDNDDVKGIYEKLKTADIVVYAGTIIDRYLSARWKTFVDRRFADTHQPLLTGKQVGYILSGPLRSLPNLREILQANAELDRANLAGIITDECESSLQLDALLDSFAGQIVQLAEEKYCNPSTFLGIGGMKIFRDEIWGGLRMVFQGDHRYYKRHGFYDFPQKKFANRMVNFFILPISRIPAVKKKMQLHMKEFMLMPYQKFVKSKSI